MSNDDFGGEVEGANLDSAANHVAVLLVDGFMVEGYTDDGFMDSDWIQLTNASEVKTVTPGYSIGAIQSATLREKCLRFAIPSGAFIPKVQIMMMLPIYEW